jgi:hypothetical protein
MYATRGRLPRPRLDYGGPASVLWLNSGGLASGLMGINAARFTGRLLSVAAVKLRRVLHSPAIHLARRPYSHKQGADVMLGEVSAVG